MKLNDQQLKAYNHNEGPALVIAGAGTGKTTVITKRIARLIAEKKATGSEILALTFTDKAAMEMEIRLDQLLPMGETGVEVMTFHSLGQKLISEDGLEIGINPQATVVTNYTQARIINSILQEMELKYYRKLTSPQYYIPHIIKFFSRLKDENILLPEYSDYLEKKKRQLSEMEDRESKDYLLLEEHIEKYTELYLIYELYIEEMTKNHYLDFGDLIIKPIELLEAKLNVRESWQKRFKYIIIDEYQDTNSSQGHLIRLLTGELQSIMAVGDDDQAIYKFRGASLENILEFSKLYDNSITYVMNKNYRSNQNILDLSYELIQNNNPLRLELTEKIDKKLNNPTNPELTTPKLDVFQTSSEEFDYIAGDIVEKLESGVTPSEIAILLRTNNQVNELGYYLNKHNIEFQVSKKEDLLSKPEIAFLVNFMNIVLDQSDSKAWLALLASEYYDSLEAEIFQYTIKAKKEHKDLVEYLTTVEFKSEKLKKSIDTIQAARLHLHNELSTLTSGQFFYELLNATGYLQYLIDDALNNEESQLKINNISKFFDILVEYEKTKESSIIHFKEYFTEILETGSAISPEEIEDNNVVQVMTMHGSKGLEFEVVYLPDFAHNVFPSINRKDIIELPEDIISTKLSTHISEERRLAYVGITRAKSYLQLSYSENRGGKQKYKASSFLNEMNNLEVVNNTSDNTVGTLAKINEHVKLSEYQQDLVKSLYVNDYLILTPHMIEDYLYNPQEFWYWNVLKLPRNTHSSLTYGTAVHNCLELFFKLNKKNEVISSEQINDVIDEAWSHSSFPTLKDSLAKKDDAFKVIEYYIDKYTNENDFPDSIEESLSLTLKDIKVKINMRLDAVYVKDGKVEIRDFKTSNIKDQKDANKRIKDNLQLRIYALAWKTLKNQDVDLLTLEFVDKKIRAITDDIDLAKTLLEIKKVSDGIRAYDFSKSSKARIDFKDYFGESLRPE